VQTVDREMEPRLYALLEEYGRRSGIPVLLNTSLNLAGEPIVNRAVEGYSTFLRSGIDVLVAGRTRVRKRGSMGSHLDIQLNVRALHDARALKLS
jgi:carbamoyltransferase